MTIKDGDTEDIAVWNKDTWGQQAWKGTKKQVSKKWPMKQDKCSGKAKKIGEAFVIRQSSKVEMSRDDNRITANTAVLTVHIYTKT